MNDIETIWIALIALLSALSLYPLARNRSRFHWFSLLSIVLLFAMAVEAGTGEQRIIQRPTPSFVGIDPVTTKYFEGLWLLMQEKNLGSSRLTNR